MSKPKVVIIGVTDWAGSAYHTCQAINSVGEFECRAITTYKHPNEHPTDILIPLFPMENNTPAQDIMLLSTKSPVYELAANELESADIIHLWNCLPTDAGFVANALPVRYSKIKVATWTGTTYREEHKSINELSQCWNQWQMVVQDPLFKFPDEIESTFIPHALDTDSFKPLPFDEREQWVGTYRPNYQNYVRPAHKDIPRLYEIVKKHKGWKVELDYTMTHLERMEKLRQCGIFVLDISPYLASWGRSGLEACALSIPTVQNSSEECIQKTNGELGEFAFVNIDWDTAEEKIDRLINDEEYRKKVGQKAKKWIEDYFSYSAVGRKYSDVYKNIL